MKNNNNKTWSGRFNEPVDKITEDYTASISFDKKLANYDIKASIAHATMLNKVGILTNSELNDIKNGLNIIENEIKNNKISWSSKLEDVHMNIEHKLINLIGNSGKKLHIARSRNDQVATDLRLWLRDNVDIILKKITILQKSLLKIASENLNIIMPGFTHLQIAQPISFAHHILAYIEMFARDYERMRECRKRINTMPLGSGALAGTTFPIDRNTTAKLLNFERISQNSIDAVSDRDFLIEFANIASIMMIHFSRISEELILWMNDNFNFIDIADRFCTGSSIMPQKKNPDVPELVRGKSSRVIGNLISLLVLMKSQPLAYNKDNQEDKESIFDTVETLLNTITIYSEIIFGIKVNYENMKNSAAKGFSTATDLADYLVKKGLSFKDSHEIVSKIVNFAISKSYNLTDISIEEFKKFSNLIENDIYNCLTLEGSINARNHLGGTAIEQIKIQINRWNNILYKINS